MCDVLDPVIAESGVTEFVTHKESLVESGTFIFVPNGPVSRVELGPSAVEDGATCLHFFDVET